MGGHSSTEASVNKNPYHSSVMEAIEKERTFKAIQLAKHTSPLRDYKPKKTTDRIDHVQAQIKTFSLNNRDSFKAMIAKHNLNSKLS